MAKATSLERPVKVRELTVEAAETQLGRVRDFVVDACLEAGFSERETSNTKLAVDEACTNIIKHAYGGSGRGGISIRIEIEPGTLEIKLHDQGKRFDYASVRDPNLDEYVETGRKGGLGVYLINRLMDRVEYNASEGGNELVLSKRSQSAISRGLIPEMLPLRGPLKYRFMMRASGGLLLLVAAIWAFVFVRQTSDIRAQRTTRWVEKRRTAENFANRSRDLLLRPDEFSVEQTNLSAGLAKLLEGSPEIAYARVVDANGRVVSSGNIEEIFTIYSDPPGTTLLDDEGRVVWRQVEVGGRSVRDIDVAVQLRDADTKEVRNLGWLHFGVYEDQVEASIKDPRVMVTLILIGVFLVGILLIMGLVSVFVKPIQVLTDGVRAIGDGTLDAKLDVGGPAEIGAIAAVFNEITNKFKRAQDSILEQEKMHKEMEVAKEIQQSLLPRKKPEVSGYDISPLYQAAAEVGGDYYDFVQVDDDTIGVVVADVSGKGVPGSLVMTMIRTALRMEARGNKNASDVMAKMNSFVTDDMKKGMFVTMFYVILDSQNRTISYASAGHNPMILYRHETNETFFLNPKGFPVGISLPDEELFRKSISLEKIKLKKDDMLLIYTDGVTEAMNERREQYGEQRLLGVIKEHGHLQPSDFVAVLERDIKKFTGGNPQNDDITVVAIKEKLAADDVLSGIRRKLIDMVEVQGMGVKEACRLMRVSPATYYRYKKRLEVMGERGLKDAVLREDTQLKRLSLEARREIMEIIKEHPEYGAKRLTQEYNTDRQEAKQVTERMVYDELKRLNLNTKELRIDYLRRNRLLKEEEVDRRTGAEIVEELLREISTQPAKPGAVEGGVVDLEARTEHDEGVVLAVTDAPDGVTTIHLGGHLDSVTSGTLEHRLKELIAAGKSKFIIDLSEVSYISSGGWGIFTGEVRDLRQKGGDVVLIGMTSEVYDVYELLGFNEVIKAFIAEKEGHTYFGLPAEERMAMAAPPVATEGGGPEGEVGVEAELPGESYVPEWESLRIEATTVGAEGDMAVLSLRGIIDTVSAENLRKALGNVIGRNIYKIVVDMSQVEYVSSGGWGTFTERLRELRRHEGDIKLFGMDPDVYYVFTMLGFNIVLSSFDVLADAIEDFGRPGKPAPEAEPKVTPGRAGASPAAKQKKPGGERPSTGRFDVDLRGRDIEKVVVWEDAGDGVLVAHLNGYIEAAAADALASGMMQELTVHPRSVLFDLTNVSYISSSGWGQFAKAYETVRKWGGTVALYGMNQELQDIYDCLEFRAFITAYPTRERAIDGVGTRDARDAQGQAPGREVLGTPTIAPEPGPSAPVVDEAGDILSVDDVLGGVGEDAGPSPGAAGPQRPEPGRWGDEAPKPAPERAPERGDPNRTEVERRFVDISGKEGAVDVGGAEADKNVTLDQNLRKIGWAAYGDRLRKRGKKKDKS